MLPKRRAPTHPGEIINEEFLIPLNLTPRQFADQLGWDEKKVNLLLQGEDSITLNMAQDLSKVLQMPVQFWMKLQDQYLQWETIHKRNEKGASKPWKKAQSY